MTQDESRAQSFRQVRFGDDASATLVASRPPLPRHGTQTLRPTTRVVPHSTDQTQVDKGIVLSPDPPWWVGEGISHHTVAVRLRLRMDPTSGKTRGPSEEPVRVVRPPREPWATSSTWRRPGRLTDSSRSLSFSGRDPRALPSKGRPTAHAGGRLGHSDGEPCPEISGGGGARRDRGETGPRPAGGVFRSQLVKKRPGKRGCETVSRVKMI